MKKYEYLVSYTFQSRIGGGGGRVFVTRNAPIGSAEDIEAIEAIQNERNNFKCAVMGFQLLRTFKDND